MVFYNSKSILSPGSERIRATLGSQGRQKFSDSLALNVAMTLRFARSHIATAAVVLVVSAGSALFAQGIFRTNTPGTAFSAEGPAGRVAVVDVAGGRKFRGGDRQ